MIKRITIFVYILLIVLLGAATFIEAFKGTDFVASHIYHALYFCLLWGVLSVLSVVVMVRFKLWKRFPAFLLHVSFLVILFGALTTYIDGKKGYIHLRTDVDTGYFTLMDRQQQIPLPFTVRLDSFNVEYYPGTQAPKDYISQISCIRADSSVSKARISMNNIWVEQGYRFYQTSFDEDSQGSFLTVNYDPWGTAITYSGYLLLAFSMIVMLLYRGGTFRELLRSQWNKSGTAKGRGNKLSSILMPVVFAFCAFGAAPASASAASGRSLPVIKLQQADSLSTIQVIYHDRVAPFNTLARDFVLKLYGAPTYHGLTPEQIVGSWVLYPERWKVEPIVYVKSASIRRLLGMTTEYACLADFFDGSTYRLQSHYGKGDQKLDQAIWELDEKIGLISMLLEGTLIKPVSENKSVAPLSPMKVNAELLYNKVPFCKILFMVNLAVGLLGLSYLFYRYLRLSAEGKYDQFVDRVITFVLFVVTATHALSYTLHGYIAGHLPLGNGYETMIFMALAILIFACAFHRKYPFVAPFGLLLSGFALLVAYLGQRNPQITPLMPVLLSPWLSSHVSLIMMSYALLAFNMLNGILAVSLIVFARKHPEKALANESKIEQLTLLSRILLYPAVFFLGIGIFLGAVWANESWGRYWAWDPKEVWALITFMVYGAAFHLVSLPAFRKPLFYHIFMVLSFLTVLMTYFGVNYVLGGMHSYA